MRWWPALSRIKRLTTVPVASKLAKAHGIQRCSRTYLLLARLALQDQANVLLQLVPFWPKVARLQLRQMEISKWCQQIRWSTKPIFLPGTRRKSVLAAPTRTKPSILTISQWRKSLNVPAPLLPSLWPSLNNRPSHSTTSKATPSHSKRHYAPNSNWQTQEIATYANSQPTHVSCWTPTARLHTKARISRLFKVRK